MPGELIIKIKTVDELARITADCRSRKERIVHCHGCFDLLHIGHIRYLQQAREMGDCLVVTVTPDRYVDKGPHRPAFSEQLRVEAIAALACVDYVAVNKWPTAEETLRLLKPSVYVKGADFKSVSSDPTGKLGQEAEVVREIGAELNITQDIVFSSSNLINRFFSGFSDDVETYLDRFRSRYPLTDILELIDRMAQLRVLVIGDALLEETYLCNLLVPARKGFVVATQSRPQKLLAEGALAVANQVAGLASQVCLATVVGGMETNDEIVRSVLDQRVLTEFEILADAESPVRYSFLKALATDALSEVDTADGPMLSETAEQHFCRRIKKHLTEWDLVLVSDSGMGVLSQDLRNLLVKHAPFLAVNTSDASECGVRHTLTRYSHVDFFIASEDEIRVATGDAINGIEPITVRLCEKLGCSGSLVTRGDNGNLAGNHSGAWFETPAFIVETAPELKYHACYVISALATFLKSPPEVVGFLGSIVQSLAVDTSDGPTGIDAMKLKKTVTSLLK